MKPRAGILLANMGLGARIPDLPPPPTVTYVVTGHRAGERHARQSGTINLPAGNAPRTRATSVTLPCGGTGPERQLTVTVGTQTFTLKGAVRPDALRAGGGCSSPSATSPTRSTKDASCSDTVAGNVMTP